MLSGCVLPVPHYTANAAQATGRVIDAQTERPIANASVAIRNHPKTQTATDFHGSFTTAPDKLFHPILFILPIPGDRGYMDRLVVSASGYHQTEQKLFAFPAGDSINHVPLVILKEPVRLRRK